MKFGKVNSIDEVDFSIPPDHPDTDRILAKSKARDMDVAERNVCRIRPTQ